MSADNITAKHQNSSTLITCHCERDKNGLTQLERSTR